MKILEDSGLLKIMSEPDERDQRLDAEVRLAHLEQAAFNAQQRSLVRRSLYAVQSPTTARLAQMSSAANGADGGMKQGTANATPHESDQAR